MQMFQRQQWSLFALGLSTLALICLTGCPPEPPNQLPVANAGADQTVQAGTNVTLNGSGSTDPDGDPLAFQWTQTGGDAVVLSNGTAANATFLAPNAATTLTFELRVSDNLGSDTDTTTVTVTTTPPPANTPKLYVANFAFNSVTAYNVSNPNAVNGNIAPTANLAGAQTLLTLPIDLVPDANGALLVLSTAAPKITSYGSAQNLALINGNVAPARNVQGAATQLVNPVSLALSRTNDLLFVADAVGGGAIRVFAGASTNAFNGNLAPVRNILSIDLVNPRGINFGANDELYVANLGNNTVAVFANASNLNGQVRATRVLQSALFAGIVDVFIDANDTLYTVSGPAGGNRVNVFANAATLNGPVTPDVTLTVLGAVQLNGVTVDGAGNGYISDPNAGPSGAIYGYDNIATRNGTIAPDRTLTGENTLLGGPAAVFLSQ
jgi:hypothetical protein